MALAATNILVVDDDQDSCASLSDILLDLGYTVDTANDGLAALELSQRNLYRLALLDYKMRFPSPASGVSSPSPSFLGS